jgi:serine/threonine-protein kinase
VDEESSAPKPSSGTDTVPANESPPEEALAKNPAFKPGARVADKYLIEKVLGEGGLGVVVAAKHEHLDQTVAIKYLRPKALNTKGVAERFLREARLAARIRSEHVVHVYDVGTLPDGSPYMVMEYLVGSDLGRQLTELGPLTVERAVDCILQACEALAEAHRAGIVHRDIKPDNLFVATSAGGRPTVKILDFGISKMSAKRGAEGDRDLTEAGDKFGTPVYMSPEQLLASGEVDARADIWAVGVVFYELLTGKMPFDGDSIPELCTAILTKDPVPLLEARPLLPAGLQAVINRRVEKDPAKRFQNVGELAQELGPFAGPAGRDRIEHTLKIVRGGGENVRAATPLPDAASARAMRDLSTLAEQGDRSTTGSGVTSWGPATVTGNVPRAPARLERMRPAAVAAAAAVAIAMLVAALAGDRTPKGKGAAASAVAPPPPVVSVVSAVPDPAPSEEARPSAPPPATQGAEGAQAPAESAQAVASAAPSATAAPARAPKAGAPGKSRAGRPSHADPNAVINPFE